jgi:Flp pilus assembly protein TadD
MPRFLLKALALDLTGPPQAAREAFEASRGRIQKLILERPDDFRLYSAMGLALAGLGRKDEALAAGRKATDLYPMSKDANGGSSPVEMLLWIQTMVGDLDGALDTARTLLSVPSTMSIERIRLSPWSKDLVRDPRFAELERKTR